MKILINAGNAKFTSQIKIDEVNISTCPKPTLPKTNKAIDSLIISFPNHKEGTKVVQRNICQIHKKVSKLYASSKALNINQNCNVKMKWRKILRISTLNLYLLSTFISSFILIKLGFFNKNFHFKFSKKK